jgi:hypothetical protein
MSTKVGGIADVISMSPVLLSEIYDTVLIQECWQKANILSDIMATFHHWRLLSVPSQSRPLSMIHPTDAVNNQDVDPAAHVN